MTADEIIARLGLQPHPEGGHYREMFRAPDCAARRLDGDLLPAQGRRALALAQGRCRRGLAPLCRRAARTVAERRRPAPCATCASAPTSSIGELPQAVVPRDVWQAARSLGAWTLVGCTVAPGFQFEGSSWRRPAGSRRRTAPSSGAHDRMSATEWRSPHERREHGADGDEQRRDQQRARSAARGRRGPAGRSTGSGAA